MVEVPYDPEIPEKFLRIPKTELVHNAQTELRWIDAK